MRIRAAELKDYPAMLEMAFAFAGADPRKPGFQEQQFANLFLAACTTEVLAMWVAVQDENIVGMMGAMIYPNLFDHSKETAQELFLWVQPSYRDGTARKGLISAFEEWAGEGRRHLLTMPATVDKKVADRLMRGVGYLPIEGTYCKGYEPCQ